MNVNSEDEISEISDSPLFLFFKWKNLDIKCEFCKHGVDLYYGNAKDSQDYEENEYSLIGKIKSEDQDDMTTILADDCSSPSYLFLVILNENIPQGSLQKLNLNCGVYITSNLFKVLRFQDNDPLLIVSTYDGYLYNLPILQQQDQANENNANIMFKTASAIIYLDVFLLEDQVNKLFEEGREKGKKKFSNCLFFITKSGEIFVYCYLNEYKFKMQTVIHEIKACIRFKDYIYYCTHNFEVYYFKLKDLLSERIKSFFLQKLNVSYFYEDNSKMYAQTVFGRTVEINEPTEERENELDDSIGLDELMSKFNQLSSRITLMQGDLDKLNKSLKQVQVLKKSEIKENVENKNGELFDAEIKLKSIDHTRYLKIKIKNKNLILEENSNDSKAKIVPTFMVLICIKLLCNESADCIWLNKRSVFTALKPTNTQKFLVNIDSLNGSNYQPIELCFYLVYNLTNLYKSSFLQNTQDDNNEFRVCIYNSKIEMTDYLLRKCHDTVDLEYNDSEDALHDSRYLQLNPCWKQIKLDNLDTRTFSNSSLISYMMKNHIKKSESEEYFDLFGNLSLKVDPVNHNLINLTASVNNKLYLTNLIRFKNEFVLKEILSNSDCYKAYFKNLQKSGIALPLQNLKEELCRKSDALDRLMANKEAPTQSDIEEVHVMKDHVINIYLKLRSIFYSNVNLNLLDNNDNNKEAIEESHSEDMSYF